MQLRKMRTLTFKPSQYAIWCHKNLLESYKIYFVNLTGQPNDRRSTRSSKHDGRPVKCLACSGLRAVGRQSALRVPGPSPCLRPGFANFCSVRGPCCCDALGNGSRRLSRTRSHAQPAGSRVCPSRGTGRCSRRGWQSLFRLFIDQCWHVKLPRRWLELHIWYGDVRLIPKNAKKCHFFDDKNQFQSP